MIHKCLEICPVCAKSNDNIRVKDKGPRISIKSFAFHSRMQVHLILDYQSDPRPDYNVVIMQWLLVIKDHFTKCTWLCATRKKEAALVAVKLSHFFHEIGFPLIFHSDNGK